MEGEAKMKLSFQDKSFLKIFAVLISVVLWMYVVSEVDVAYTHLIRNVPVRLRNMDRSLEVMNEEPITIDVRVRGKRSIVSVLTKDDIRADIDLLGRSVGTNAVSVVVTVPDNVELLDTRPAVAEVRLDEVITQYFEVEIEFSGRPLEGYFYGTYSVIPQDVFVRGPRSIINSISKILTVVPVDGVNKSFSRTFPIQVLDRDRIEVRRVSIRPDFVEVFVPVGSVHWAKVTPDINVTTAENYIVTGMRVIPSNVEYIWLNATPPIGELKTERLSLRNIDSTIVVTDLELVLPHGLELINRANTNVKLEVLVDRIVTETFDIEPVIRNLGSGLKVNLELQLVTVTLNGPQTAITQLKNNNQWIYIDLRSLTEGSHNTVIHTDLPEAVHLHSISNVSMQVNVTTE
jgi:YbbR domain-containing protein